MHSRTAPFIPLVAILAGASPVAIDRGRRASPDAPPNLAARRRQRVSRNRWHACSTLSWARTVH